MINIIMIMPAVEAMNYGIGSYLSSLINESRNKHHIHFHIIITQSKECTEFFIEYKSKNLTFYTVPMPIASPVLKNFTTAFTRYTEYVALLLSKHLGVLARGVYHLNLPISYQYVIPLKKIYDFPIVSVVHYTYWQFALVGNKTKLESIWKNYKLNNLCTEQERVIIKKCLAEQRVYQNSDKIISVTCYMRNIINKYYDIDFNKIVTITNGLKVRTKKCDKKTLKNLLHIESSEKIILFVGRVDIQKGIEPLLAAFKLLLKKHRNVRLILAGGIKISAYRTLCDDIWSRVHFLGQVEKQLLVQLYNIADIGVHPSLYDHCPYAVLEMMAHKIPIIVSDTEGLNEIILDGSNGLYVKHEINKKGDIKIDVQHLYHQLSLLLTDEQRAHEIGMQAYKSVIKKHSSKRMMDSTLKIYEHLCRANQDYANEISCK